MINKIKLQSRSTNFKIEFWDYRLIAPLFRNNVCEHDYLSMAGGIIVNDEEINLYKLTGYDGTGFFKNPSVKPYAIKAYTSNTATFYRNNFDNRTLRFNFFDVNTANIIFNLAILQTHDLLLMTIETTKGTFEIDVSVNGLVTNGQIELIAYDPRFRVTSNVHFEALLELPDKVGRKFFPWQPNLPDYFADYNYDLTNRELIITDVLTFANPVITLQGTFTDATIEYLGKKYYFSYEVYDEMVIDCLNKTVTVDGVERLYTGEFIEVKAGNSIMTFDFETVTTSITAMADFQLKVMVIE